MLFEGGNLGSCGGVPNSCSKIGTQPAWLGADVDSSGAAFHRCEMDHDFRILALESEGQPASIARVFVVVAGDGSGGILCREFCSRPTASRMGGCSSEIAVWGRAVVAWSAVDQPKPPSCPRMGRDDRHGLCAPLWGLSSAL